MYELSRNNSPSNCVRSSFLHFRPRMCDCANEKHLQELDPVMSLSKIAYVWTCISGFQSVIRFIAFDPAP